MTPMRSGYARATAKIGEADNPWEQPKGVIKNLAVWGGARSVSVRVNCTLNGTADASGVSEAQGAVGLVKGQQKSFVFTLRNLTMGTDYSCTAALSSLSADIALDVDTELSSGPATFSVPVYKEGSIPEAGEPPAVAEDPPAPTDPADLLVVPRAPEIIAAENITAESVVLRFGMPLGWEHLGLQITYVQASHRLQPRSVLASSGQIQLQPGQFGDWKPRVNVTAFGATSLEDAHLDPGSVYEYSLVAYTNDIASVQSNVWRVVTCPSPPVLLDEALSVSVTAASLGIDPPSDGSAAVAVRVLLTRQLYATGERAELVAREGSPPALDASVQFTDTGVKPGRTYTYTATYALATGYKSRPSSPVTMHTPPSAPELSILEGTSSFARLRIGCPADAEEQYIRKAELFRDGKLIAQIPACSESGPSVEHITYVDYVGLDRARAGSIAYTAIFLGDHGTISPLSVALDVELPLKPPPTPAPTPFIEPCSFAATLLLPAQVNGTTTGRLSFLSGLTNFKDLDSNSSEAWFRFVPLRSGCGAVYARVYRTLNF
eukprot:tig00000042_g15591.t1